MSGPWTGVCIYISVNYCCSGYLLVGTTVITQPNGRPATGIRQLDEAVQRRDYDTAISPSCGFILQKSLARRHIRIEPCFCRGRREAVPVCCYLGWWLGDFSSGTIEGSNGSYGAVLEGCNCLGIQCVECG